MKTRNETTRLSVVALAVASLLNATPARADDEEVKALVKPTNTVELGVYNINGSSAKYGEYKGLNKAGANLIGNLDVRGGDAYDNQGGTTRWSLFGSDLGLTSQSLGATFSQQGQWKLGFGYDELRHNLADSYQTPYVGSMGGNSFTLPTGFGLVPNTTAMTAAQLAALHTLDIATTRKNTALNGELALNARWGLSFDINHLDQTGAKLSAFGSASPGGFGVTGEMVSIVPLPTNYTTDTVKLGLNWMGDKGHLTTSYTGSFFRDGYDRMTVQTWAGASRTQTVAMAPGNDFHQLSLTGGYAFAPKTKLAGSLAYGINTQNDAFVVDSFMLQPGFTPKASLGGMVQTTHADLKLTDQTTKNLLLAAGLKYDVRDNRTDSDIYNFYSIGGHVSNWPTAPRSYKKIKYELSGDYRLDKDRHFRLDYEHESINRWCDSYAVNAGYPAGTNCVVATSSQEDKIGGTYRAKASESVDYRVGYSVAKRLTDSDPLARTPFYAGQGNFPGPTIAGLNGGDYPGFYPAFDASRTQQIIRGNTNWQANDKLSFGAGARYTQDVYASTYGEQNGYTWSMNLDVNYAYSEDLLISSYLTKQHRQREMTDKQGASAGSATTIVVPANSTWSDTLKDDDITLGLGAKRKGLMSGKLELAADLTYTLSDLGYNTTLNYNAVTTTGVPCTSPTILSCGDIPNIVSETTQLKLTGIYTVDKSSKVLVRYIYQQLNSTDYFYNAYQLGATPTQVMPTNQQAPNYNVNVITVGYIYNF